jgi:diguanylate cyclase (GGDEF)-like protein
MIVEDSEQMLKQLIGILGKDYHTVVARSGQEAFNTLLEEIPDLIVHDVMLPDMNGKQMIKVLKNTFETQDIPIIVITGLRDDERESLALGAVDCILKPLDPIIVKLRIVNQMRMVNQLKLIKKLSGVDELTGLPNRRSFEERLAMVWRKAKREKKPISLLMIDIDRFKVYNDTHGHLQGDQALKELAKILNASLRRAGDFAVRWGGEEFSVLLPDTSLEGAMIVAEHIRSQTEAAVIRCFDESETRVTVSIGICTHIPTQKCGAESFVGAADKALYQAKDEGRNRICHQELEV